MPNKPVQQHYLPKKAYLKFFESPEKEGSIWMYQRKGEPVLASIENVAKERHLYSFTDENGNYNYELEVAFSEMEQIASNILKKMNEATGEIFLTGQEKFDLAYFLAMQAARTPAFRELQKKQAEEFAKLNMKARASNKDILARDLERTRKENPGLPDVSVEDMQDFIMNDRYKLDWGKKNDNYFLKQAIELGDHIFPTVAMKDILMLKSEFEFITSDYPVMLISDPSIPPFWAGGFLHSGILFPIGKNTALFLKNPLKPTQPPAADEQIVVGYKKIAPAFARWVNKTVIGYTERFLFSSSLEPKIKEIFDKTEPPKRFYMDSPFNKDKERDEG
ncbi:MAG: DUF4238 domain-containing protein [Candidatus Staskawiczbacteria bacterium]|jgi:hypothetical protein